MGSPSFPRISSQEEKMTTKIDVVLEHLAVENQHNMEAMLATLDSNNPIRDEVAGNCYVGTTEVANRYAELWKSFPDFNVFPRRLIEQHNSVVMLADYSGTHHGTLRNSQGEFAPTGRSFNVRIVNVIDFIGDRISRETIYMDAVGQLKQLGIFGTRP
jgi:steroid delta-isomerase-like uncharacterized protein